MGNSALVASVPGLVARSRATAPSARLRLLSRLNCSCTENAIPAAWRYRAGRNRVKFADGFTRRTTVRETLNAFRRVPSPPARMPRGRGRPRSQAGNRRSAKFRPRMSFSSGRRREGTGENLGNGWRSALRPLRRLTGRTIQFSRQLLPPSIEGTTPGRGIPLPLYFPPGLAAIYRLASMHRGSPECMLNLDLWPPGSV